MNDDKAKGYANSNLKLGKIAWYNNYKNYTITWKKVSLC